MKDQKKLSIQLDPSKLMGFESSKQEQQQMNSKVQAKVGSKPGIKPPRRLQSKVGFKPVG